MPPNSANPNNQQGWGPIWQIIQQMQQQLATYQTTTAYTDNHGNSQVIIGKIDTDPRTGAPTGIAAGTFGIAFLQSGTWRSLAAMTFP